MNNVGALRKHQATTRPVTTVTELVLRKRSSGLNQQSVIRGLRYRQHRIMTRPFSSEDAP